MLTRPFGFATRTAGFVFGLVAVAMAAGCRGSESLARPPVEQVPPRPRIPSLSLGALVPDVEFRNQDDRPVRLSEYRGHIVLATFVYTRCPFPDYCPRLMAQVQGLRRLLARDRTLWDAVRMAGVTIDPAHDTPAVLRGYGRSMLGDRPFEHLDLLTASPAVVEAFAALFGVTYRDESGQLTHTLSTALIDRDGRVANVLDGSQWNVDDVAAAVCTLARAPRAALP